MKRSFLFFVLLEILTFAQIKAGLNRVFVKDVDQQLHELYRGSYALLVGVSDYENKKVWPDLKSIPGEMEQIHAALAASGFSIRELKNPDSKTLKQGIENFLNDYGYERENRLLIYFSGHGQTLGGRGFLVPADAPSSKRPQMGFYQKALPMGQILAWSRQVLCKHLLVLFDSCYSGLIFNTKEQELNTLPLITSLTLKPVREFISSGNATQRVPATSLFATYFVKGLLGDGDLNEDGYVTGMELGMYLKARIAGSGSDQEPQYNKMAEAEWNEGDFIFVAKAKKSKTLAKDGRTPAYGTLLLTSTANGKLFLDGIARQNLKASQPARLDRIPAGQHQLLIESEGCETIEQSVLIQANQLKYLACVPIKKSAVPVVLEPGHLRELQVPGTGEVIRLKWCPPGGFMRGSPENEMKRERDEIQHRVILSQGFWLGETEVTQGLWLAVMNKNPSEFKSGLNRPVDNLSWLDCQEFLRKLSEKMGVKFRLPTEAEWEFACRAGSKTAFCYGDKLTASMANFDGNYPYGALSAGAYLQKTAEVKSYTPNAWGLYDMHGNLWEWCADWYGPYPNGEVTNPLGSQKGSARVLRGGCWYYDGGGCRSATRGSIFPDRRHTGYGFRICSSES